MKKIKIQSILTAVAGLLLATSCSSSFLDTEPTDAVSSDQVAVAGNAERLFNGAWYNLFEYGTTYANIGYRALQCQDDMMASDVVSRPKYGFNSSYQFNDIAIPSDGRTSFAWYLILRFPLKGTPRNFDRHRGRHWLCVLFVIYIWYSIISLPI